jgi:hypothetical protein
MAHNKTKQNSLVSSLGMSLRPMQAGAGFWS